MPSSYGKKRGLPGYDHFRTGLTYKDVWEMLRDESENSKEWKYKTRGVVLWHWHELKMQLYQQMIEIEGGENADT